MQGVFEHAVVSMHCALINNVFWQPVKNLGSQHDLSYQSLIIILCKIGHKQRSNVITKTWCKCFALFFEFCSSMVKDGQNNDQWSRLLPS